MISTLPDIFSSYRNTVRPDLYTDLLVPISLPANSAMETSDSSSCNSDGDKQLYKIPAIEDTYKCVDLTPSSFIHGCVCGHDVEYRDAVYENRRRKRGGLAGLTFKPKVAPIAAKLRKNI